MHSLVIDLHPKKYLWLEYDQSMINNGKEKSSNYLCSRKAFEHTYRYGFSRFLFLFHVKFELRHFARKLLNNYCLARAKFVFCHKYIKNSWNWNGKLFLSELILNRLEIGRLFHISTFDWQFSDKFVAKSSNFFIKLQRDASIWTETFSFSPIKSFKYAKATLPPFRGISVKVLLVTEFSLIVTFELWICLFNNT